MKILFINACIRKDSRTLVLARYLLSKLEGDITELNLPSINLQPLNEETLNRRSKLIREGNYDMFKEAKLFRDADCIVIATPYYDLSFSAHLKNFIENINVDSLTFKFESDGSYKGLCKAKDCYYVTTSGGEFLNEHGFNYIRDLCHLFYGIPNVHLIKAENLDIGGTSISNEIEKAKKEIDKLFQIK